MPSIRLGGEAEPSQTGPPGPRAKLRTREVVVGGVPTRALSAHGTGPPTVLLHGWLDNADTWLAVLERLAVAGRPAVAHDLPGFGTAPPLDDDRSVLDQLVEFAAASVAEAASKYDEDVIVAGNSLGGWVCLKLAERSHLPLAGVVPIAPAGIQMAPAFFTLDRVPAIARVISMPAPVPSAFVRSIAGQLYRALAYADPAAVDQRVVDRFTRFNVDRGVIRRRLEYAKRLREELGNPFDAAQIDVPVTVLWGDCDRLCLPSGAQDLAKALPAARIEMLAGVGHTPQVECPDRVVEAILALAG